MKAFGTIGPSGVDTFTAAVVEFPRGIIAELVCGVTCQMPIDVTVFGTKGRPVPAQPLAAVDPRAHRA